MYHVLCVHVLQRVGGPGEPRDLFPPTSSFQGGILALCAHCALLLDYVPPEEPQANPLETPSELGDPNCPSSRNLQNTFPSHNTHHARLEKP